MHPPLDVEGRAPVDEDSKGDNWDGAAPSTLLLLLPCPPCQASREGEYHALGTIHDPPSVLSAPCPMIDSGLGVGTTNHISSSRIKSSWAVSNTAFESSRLGEPGVRGLLGLLIGRLPVVYKNVRSLPHHGVVGMAEEKGEGGKERGATGRGWLISVEENAVMVK